MVSMALTMIIYKTVIYSTTKFTYAVFNHKIHSLVFVLNLFILTFYHSFNCFNNLWQYKKLNLTSMISMCEHSWPYYVGYGMFASILYIYSQYIFVRGLYNLYSIIISLIPFLIKNVNPEKKPLYPKINLLFFSVISSLIVDLTKKICQHFRNNE